MPFLEKMRFAGRGGDPEERLSAPSLKKGGCPSQSVMHPYYNDFAFLVQ